MEVKIGLEIHVQLNTKTKLFCGCPNPINLKEEPEPNSLVCPTCLGFPGSKPRLNAKAFETAKKVAVALNFTLAEETFFSRKTYFYPDMSKNFQITQYEIPIGRNGFLEMEINGKKKRIGLKRIHLEEDPAKLVHVGGMGGKYVLVDYNRSGIPLIEVVTDPDFKSPEEARVFLHKFAMILEYLGVYDDCSKAVIKSDANISLSIGGRSGNRVEIKNITGTREVELALKYEIVRQKNLLKSGTAVKTSTRMWNPDLKVTQEMRKKETEEDYGYIFEPDLTRMEIRKDEIISIKRNLPELPEDKQKRFIKIYGFHEKLAEALVSEPDIAELFEYAAKKISPHTAGTWITGYLKKTLNWHGIRFKESGLEKEWIVKLLKMFERGLLTDRGAELIIRKMVEEKKDPEYLVEKYGLKKIKSNKEIEKIVDEIIKRNPKAVSDYKSGVEKVLHYLVGLCMRETHGRADADAVRKILIKKLGA